MKIKINPSKLKEIKHELLFGAFLYPFRQVKYCPESKNKNRIREEEIVKYFCLESICGLGKQLANRVIQFHEGMQLILECLNLENNNNKNNIEEKHKLIGRVLFANEDEWVYIMLLVQSLLNAMNKNNLSLLFELDQWIEQSSLLECWKWKPLYNGQDIIQDFPIFKNKANLKHLSSLLNELLLYRFCYPNLDKSQAKIFLSQWIQHHLPPSS